jgi:indolepyruvate ferredoxin oxidoreductase alpha subunit
MVEKNIQTLNGDQALAYGAMASGIKLVASYPGSPSSGTVEALIKLSREHDMYVEWSSNEKVAIEMGIGASIAGRRALVCAKSVGMNLMVDPLMALNLTPVKGGLVILLGDDPGAYGSQNDQDTRPLAHILEMPIFEPASPAEGYTMIREAFTVSEEFNTAVIVRETRSFTQQFEPVPLADDPYPEVNRGFEREPWRFVPVPRNAVEKHRELHDRLMKLSQWVNSARYNQIWGAGRRGILAAGFVYQKLIDVIGSDSAENYQVLKLSTHYPLPEKVVSIFLKGCDEVLILEENEPFVEMQIKAHAHNLGTRTEVLGKQSGHVSREGELYRWMIQEALEKFLPGFVPVTSYLKENEADEIPKKESYCAEAGYDAVLDTLEAAAESVGQKLVLVGDPGCLVTVAERLDAKYAIGSSIGVAGGLSKVGIDERAVALFGDSAFFHSSIPALCNVVHNRSDILMVVLDNESTASTGHQPHPGIGEDAMGHDAPKLDIEQIARACGLKRVHTVTFDEYETKLISIFREVLSARELALVQVQTRPSR